MRIQRNLQNRGKQVFIESIMGMRLLWRSQKLNTMKLSIARLFGDYG